MKILQLNIWGGRLEPQILKLLEKEKPDILCLQEAIDVTGGKAALFVTIEEIQETLGVEYVFHSPVVSLNYMSRRANFGNCIMSKYKIDSKQTIFTGKEFDADFEFLNHSFNVRNLQLAVISLPGGAKLNVLNHHGHHIHQHKNGDEETMRQCAIIAKEIKKLSGPVILTGDFNLKPDSQSLNQINDLLTNLPAKFKLDTTRTELTHKTEVCDYIFVNDQIKVISFEALDDVVSDHKALTMEFDLV